jgi:cytochrome c1
LAVAGAAAAATTVPAVTLMSDDGIHPPSYPWRHRGFFSSYDCGALRRGFQVYREVCATCHSLELIRWREVVGVTHTKDEVKNMCKEVEVLDGPNMEGEMFERPAKLYDKLPSPYANEQIGRNANGGAYPPDLSLMVKARDYGTDYIMALLTGYMEAPAGKVLMEGLYYNPYFAGGAIRMPPPLQDEGVEYEDGTVATASQQGRDVVQFLSWSAEPERDIVKPFAIQVVFGVVVMAAASGYFKRYKWAPLKTRRIGYVKGM